MCVVVLCGWYCGLKMVCLVVCVNIMCLTLLFKSCVSSIVLCFQYCDDNIVVLELCVLVLCFEDCVCCLVLLRCALVCLMCVLELCGYFKGVFSLVFKMLWFKYCVIYLVWFVVCVLIMCAEYCVFSFVILTCVF